MQNPSEQVEFSDVIDESINHILKLIDPKLKKYTDLAKKITLLDALHELEVNDAASTNCLSGKYKELLENEKELRQEYCSQPSYLDRLYGKKLEIILVILKTVKSLKNIVWL